MESCIFVAYLLIALVAEAGLLTAFLAGRKAMSDTRWYEPHSDQMRRMKER
ncbi:hypothetical protein [Altererythrobacter sp. Root672]|uniref:hypothetical protein n=1 Tax=Altererythrobacter sp. Root672 TaxID=1736584 RepID=UPI000AE705ED|nr:hypothetical protein [Altererythrobacter sp. Root672]